ncbi:hypothetical protein [Nocardia niwae]|uniref:YHS domain-containing protein n=1 Tax=Nocardia niwae TaxID=626084 RepID=A0ABV2X9F7_9NOCA|nr:hypothetical protein [Nocardia niwae]
MRIAGKPCAAQAFALVPAGLLAGAFGYGAVNVLYAFRRVPSDVRFTLTHDGIDYAFCAPACRKVFTVPR